MALSWTLILVALSVLVLRYVRRSRDALPLPPGPGSAFPMLGHLLVMPLQHESLTYQRWSRQLGSDVICLRVLGRHMIILNSIRAVTDLLEGKAAIYSDRPRLYALKELIGLQWLYGLMPYGKPFLDVRKAASKYLHPEPIKQYRPLQHAAVSRCLSDIQRSPDDFAQHFTLLAGHTILGVAYGIEPSLKDAYLKNVNMAVEGLRLGLSPRALLYDLLPITQWLPDWLPGLGVKKEAQKYIKHTTELPELPLQATRAAMEKGTAPTSMAASMLADNELGYDVVRSVTGSLYFVPLHSSVLKIIQIVATLSNFLLAMLKYPSTQVKAQAEIDAHLQHTRLPSLGGGPATPLATPHALTADDTYRGMRLPKDAIVIGNVHAIVHDPALVGPNPDTFDPERYLSGSPAKELDVLFGFGPRVCPGRHLARATIWLAVVSIPEEGEEVSDGYTEFTSGVVAAPLPFKCRIVPRAGAVEALRLAGEL
ncbi:cytochrome P450 [Roridomyces roridus]|uniref:Cytochrome P450 n=1 Tax=Roridomyces roridus TaxID=1738132 RepID=A0AAD7FGC4_9AGAR|nr:cytochrome P450 [Roridomyces roridus]